MIIKPFCTRIVHLVRISHIKLPMHSLKLPTAAVWVGVILVGYGGSSMPAQSATISDNNASTYVPQSRSTTTAPAPASTATVTAPTSSGTYVPQSREVAPTSPSRNTPGAATLTDIRFESMSNVAQTNVPVTFGQIFAPGHLAANATLSGRLDNGVTVPLQLDTKARHPDGSVRHAIISAILPSLGAKQVLTMMLDRSAGAATTARPTASLLNAGFTASVNATIGGVRYTASADQLLRQATAKAWLAGATANEWLVSAPLTTSAGVAHPHLTARFSLRWYEAARKARVDVVIENNWAYEKAPQNFTYNAEVLVGGKAVYTKPSLQHYHHARWRKVFWWNGSAPEVNVKHNTAYLIDSRALPNYDRSLRIPGSVLDTLKSRWSNAATGPMGTGLSEPYMPATGGRNDIGLLPQWAAVYLLTMDHRARDATLGTAELAGSYSAHYRDQKTGQPVSLIDYPYMTMLGRPGDAVNPATGRSEAFPACASSSACTTPYSHDVSHQPAFAYLPYVLTGDHYFLEELQFWGMYNVFNSNPAYREGRKGLLSPEQVRGQAWGLRTLAEAAYITPDNDRLKTHFNQILDSNLDWYNANYPNNPNANKLGAIVNGYSLVYSNGRGLAPWQDDFFTAAVGHAHDLGFTKATTLLKYKVKFPIERMVGNGACWIGGSEYAMNVRASANAPLYSTIGQVYAATSTKYTSSPCGSATMAGLLGLKVGEMSGYSSSVAGYPSNMQPALAYAADIGGTTGARAWSVFMSRSVKPDYALGPQFNIVPRTR
ncbi:RIFT barrel domain-containing protein [Massilia consociata]|uniref:PcRGLX/YetA-like N-terminal RIFT barrel domain-containing protein n=1 Tax=Massilia consociata TaxID=760117 RepID=A0ABV6FCV5_9BURK